MTQSIVCAFDVRFVPCRFTGKERDAESGLDYFGARYFGSSMGRWMSPDWSAKEEPVPYSKLDDPQTLNLYGYVRNNPLSRADPDGHQDGDCQPACDSMAGSPFEGIGHSQMGGGIFKIALGSGLVATAAAGDIPGGAFGAVLLTNTTIGGTVTTVSGVTDVVGAATHTDVTPATQALSATSNVGGLVTTAATGSLDAGKVGSTVTSVATLARNPAGALRNPATMVKAVKTADAAVGMVKDAVNTVRGAVQSGSVPPPPAPPPPPTPPCSVAGACHT